MATKETERLDDASIERAIELLDNRGTKKDACAILGINYNTTRLASIIDKYKEKKLIEETKRRSNRKVNSKKIRKTKILRKMKIKTSQYREKKQRKI